MSTPSELPVTSDAANDATPIRPGLTLHTLNAGMAYLGVGLLCLASACIGVAIDHRFFTAPVPPPKVALAEEGAVVLGALLDRPELASTSNRQLIRQAVLQVMSKYQLAGYVIVDAAHGPDGEYAIQSLPQGAIDITPEMRAAVSGATATVVPGARGTASLVPAAPASFVNPSPSAGTH